MKSFIVALVVACFLTSFLTVAPARAADSKNSGAVNLGKKTANDPANDAVIASPENNPARSNKNDDKDENPDDGDAGGGNDDRDVGGE